VAGPRVVDLAGRHRALLDRSIRVGASIAFVATTLVAIFVRDGDWPAQRFLLVYFAPMLAYGAAWARDRLAHIDQVAPVLSAVDAFAFAAGALRAAGGWGILPYGACTPPRRLSSHCMQQPIIGYHLDERGDWVADLRCGHGQHVRHDPPWQLRPWVLTAEGRASFLGVELECLLCEEQQARHES
jgi:hypothetical protein